MKPKLHIGDLVILLIMLCPFLYLGYVYNSLPARVPTHFGLDGKPNDYSSRQSMWWITALIEGVNVFVFLLLRFLPVIDPKKKAQYSAPVFNKIAVAVTLLLSGITCLAINAAQKGSFNLSGAVPVLMGVFFAFMGNVMNNIKPNYFAGIRTPWTLESEETWRRTHRFGGKLWFFGGIFIAIMSLVLPATIEKYFLLGSIFILAIIPIVYSYTCYRSIQKNNNTSS